MAARHRSSRPYEALDPWDIMHLMGDRTSTVPDIIEFVMSDQYLNRPNIYPRQATLLKVIFCQTELFTQYDYDVIEQWTESYLRTEDSSGYGNNGTQPDLLDRIEICRSQGRRWFREFLFVGGRRGGKGHIGALAGAYVLWHYLVKGDPQAHYGVDRDKQLGAFVFAAKKEQAKAFQWRDLKNVITGGPCFTGGDGVSYISKNLEEKLTIYAPHDFMRMHEYDRRGVNVDSDIATFTIEPKESTLVSARGPALFMEHFDEMAWVERGTAKSSAGEVYDQAKPALDQFGIDAFIPQLSSPWQKSGKFYENYERALEKNEDGTPAYPEMLMVQLASWDIYEDWEYSTEIPCRPIPESEEIRHHREKEQERLKDLDLAEMFAPLEDAEVESYAKGEGGPAEPLVKTEFFPRIRGAIQAYDDQMRQEERANPETFKVERRAHFATVQDAYLNPERVSEIWLPWPDRDGEPFIQKDRGILSVAYRAHGDPSKSGAHFGFAIGHREGPDESGLYHVVFDRIHAWTPGDFENNEIDYPEVEEEIKVWIKGFMPVELTFDQYNCLAGDTKIFTGTGVKMLREIAGDLDVDDSVCVEVPVQSQHGAATLTTVYRRGPSVALRFSTKLGTRLTATPEHRLWVRKAKAKSWHDESEWGWLEASEIEKGDWLCLRRNNLMAQEIVDVSPYHSSAPIRSDARMERYPDVCGEDLAFVLGAMVSEGKCVSGDDCSFSNSDREFMAEFLDAWENVFGGEWNPSWLPATEVWQERGSLQAGKGISQFFMALGAGGLSQEKQVPWVIESSPVGVVRSFLRSLFEGDGGVTLSAKAGEWVHLTTTSEELAEGVQHLLLGLGVFSTLWRGWYTYKGERRRQFRVKVFGPDITDFAREVGFVSTEKRGLLSDAVGVIRDRGGRTGIRSKHQRHGDEYWVRVTEIEEVEADCYDVSVPGPESFIANGHVSHNSVGSIQRLRTYVRGAQLPKHVTIYERTATGPLNWQTYETFKTALGMGLVHGPYFELAHLELTFLQDLGGKVDCPTVGPVQTKDVADVLSIVTYELIGEQVASFMGKTLGDMKPKGAAQGGIDPYANQTEQSPHDALANFGRSRGRTAPQYGRRNRR